METQTASRPNIQDFDPDVVALIQSAVSEPISPLTLIGFFEGTAFNQPDFVGRVLPGAEGGISQLEVDVLSVLVAEQEANDIVTSLQPQLAPHGYQAFVTATGDKDFCPIFHIGISEAIEKYDEMSMIVFFKAQNAASLLWVRQTNGANYDVMTSDILHKLDEWSQQCSFRIIGAGYDWIELEFASLPQDILAFAEDIYELCPDTLDQNVVKAPPEGLSEEELLDFIEDAIDEQDPEDLAEFLQREKRLFLWWD